MLANRRVIIAALVIATFTPATVSADATASQWRRPVGGSVVRPFRAPAWRFGAGHLGVDLAAPAGTPVRAAGGGVVTFAGAVAGSTHVVVAHGGDLRTSYSFMRDARVHRGQRLATGDVVGTSGGIDGDHGGRVVHFGLRRGDTYIDPMQLFAPLDLTEAVHLAPVRDPLFRTVLQERGGVLDGIRGALGGALGGGLSLVRGAGRLGAEAIAVMSRPLVEIADKLGETAWPALVAYLTQRFLPFRIARYLWIAADIAVDYIRHKLNCDDDAPRANGEGGSGHRVMLVGGIDSHTDGARPALDLPTQVLGYEPQDVSGFSYSDTAAYDENDTYRPIMEPAQRLAEQLRELERRDPGRQVDLIAHSQGGLVVLAFLKLLYDPLDMTYPPLGQVVTLSAPLEGAPLATFLDDDKWVIKLGRAGWGIAAQNVDALPFPDARAPSIDDMAQDSDLVAELDARDLPATIELTTLGVAFDYVVPGNVATTDGARHTVIGRLWAHSEVLRDSEALRAVRSALEGDDELPCVPAADFAAGRVAPMLLTDIEESLQYIPG